MRLNLFLGDPGNVDDEIKRVVAAEHDGFYGAWFGQIFQSDALTTISLAGRQTERIELGTAVIPTYVRHPYALAQQALTAQAATKGRLTLGIGPSHQPVVEQMWGLSYERPARHVREYLAVLRALVQDGQTAFGGDVYKVAAGLRVQGATPFPILIAALAPAMLRVAGEHADGTVTWMTGPKTIASHIAPRINAAAEAAGRPQPRVCVALPIAVTDESDAARATVGGSLAIYGQLVNYRRVLDKEGADGPADVAIIGDEASVEQQLRDLADAGATDFLAAAFPAGDDPQASLTRTNDLLKSLIGKI